jgi:4-cresol dehydrogenase (hydroxylating)
MESFAALPPGVSKEKFSQALKEYRAILGEENVIAQIERLTPYTKIMIPESETLHQPSGVVVPRNVEQVQRVLAISNKYKVPVWPISIGRNLGYGSAAPASPGQLVMDLRRMNKILEVDPVMCTALVEPGVTYTQLDNYLREKNYPLWLSFPSSGGITGPVGNTLDRGVGYNRYGQHMANFCGLEVAMASGELLRTGMGGVANSNTWQSYRWGYGPWLDGLFTQSNLGVVTKMGLWLMPAPPANKSFVVGWADDEGAARGVDVARELTLAGVLENGVLGHALYGLASEMRRTEIYTGPGSIPEEVVAQLCKKLGIGLWNFVGTLYGTQEQVDVNWRIVKSAFAASGGQVFAKDEIKESSMLNHWHGNMTGKLDLSEFGIYNFRGGGGSAWFAPVVQARGSEALKQIKMTKAVMTEFGFDYLGGFLMGGRHMDHVSDLLFDRSNPEEMKRAYACFDKLIAINAAAGYAVYRTNTAFMDKVADTYGPVQRAIQKKLKRALDPNGIIAPGKSGIRI